MEQVTILIEEIVENVSLTVEEGCEDILISVIKAVAVPLGGTTGQSLVKSTDENFEVIWKETITTDQKDAMDNANGPDAANYFLTLNDCIGGLPTGEIPSGFASKNISQTITDTSFVDVSNMSINITVASSVRFYGIATLEVDTTIKDTILELILIINGEESTPFAVDFAKEGNRTPAINFRTTNPLSIGSHVCKLQARVLTGGDSADIIAGKLFGMALQAPLGEVGTIATKDFWSGTEAEYAALGTWDNNTLYFTTT